MLTSPMMSKTHSSMESSKDHEWNEFFTDVMQLNTRNKELLKQYEHSKEELRDYKAKTRQLQINLDEAQRKIQHVELSNAELHCKVSNTQQENTNLSRTKERLNRELNKLKDKFRSLSLMETIEEVKTMLQMVIRTMEVGGDIQDEYEAKQCESKSQLELVTQDLKDAHNLNTKLKSRIRELESKLQQQQIHRLPQPFSSTPHHQAQPPHGEILRNGGSPMSPLRLSMMDHDTSFGEDEHYSTSFVEDGLVEETSWDIQKDLHVSPAIKSLAKMLDETDTVVQLKHSLIMRDLGGLMPSPSNSYQTTTNTVHTWDEQFLSRVETRLKSMMRKKNQFKNENMNLKRENSDLREKLKRLEEKLSLQQLTLSLQKDEIDSLTGKPSLTFMTREPVYEPPAVMECIVDTRYHPDLQEAIEELARSEKVEDPVHEPLADRPDLQEGEEEEKEPVYEPPAEMICIVDTEYRPNLQEAIEELLRSKKVEEPVHEPLAETKCILDAGYRPDLQEGEEEVEEPIYEPPAEMKCIVDTEYRPNFHKAMEELQWSEKVEGPVHEPPAEMKCIVDTEYHPNLQEAIEELQRSEKVEVPVHEPPAQMKLIVDTGYRPNIQEVWKPRSALFSDPELKSESRTEVRIPN